MLKYIDTKIVFREVPDEVTLAINISGCPFNCRACHSEYLQYDAGRKLTEMELDYIICSNEGMSCIAFMGGDGDVKSLIKAVKYVKNRYPRLKIAWYSGNTEIADKLILKYLDYIKIGPFILDLGPLNFRTTNQRMYKVEHNSDKTVSLIDITYKFWKDKEPQEIDEDFEEDEDYEDED